MMPGKIIHIKNINGKKDNYWYVESICPGATNQESVIHISRAGGVSKPTCLGEERSMFVPRVMVEWLIKEGIAKVYDNFADYEHELTA